MPDHPPPRVSSEDLRQILITIAFPAFRYGILTHGAHKARFHIVALVTDNPAPAGSGQRVHSATTAGRAGRPAAMYPPWSKD